MGLNPRTYQFLVGVFASFGSFLYGYDLGVIDGSVAAPSFLREFNNPNPNEIGAVVALFTGGGFFGAFAAGPMGDWLGRRLAIMIGAIVFCLGGSLQAAAQNLAFLYAGRFVAGLGVGVLVMIIPLYQAEIAHPEIRGRITGLQQFMLGIGAAVASWTTYGTNLHLTDNTQWRLPLGLQIVPAAILALLILLFPESPRWLIDHGKEEEGLKTLAKLHAHGNTEDPWVLAEYHQVKRAIAIEHEQAKGYRDLFSEKSSFRRLVLVTALQASVQMTGVSAIQYFSPDIYATIRIGTTDTLKYQGISNVLAIVAQLCTILFVDRIGRRWPLIIGNIINGVCFVIVTAAIASFNKTSSESLQHSLGWLFIVTNWIYQISFSFTCGSLSWIIPAEVFDTKTRSKGVSIGVMVSFAFNTMIGQITAPAIKDIQWRYFLLFVVCNFTNAIFFWAFMPETAKRPLEEMNALFSQTSWFIPTANTKNLITSDLEAEAEEIKLEKQGVMEIEHEKYQPSVRNTFQVA